ncbi:MAG TPA: class I SAM-dependent methyltransferase [Edaphobacter sp.]|nr:class I SAM-dependent methyltransferase [Edaphobacter sp.]
MSNSAYVLGSSPRELSRLSLQAQMIGPTTERLLRQVGIKEGSRVLDLGCGAGDVSMLTAEMVGPTGSVVGIDQSAAAIDKAEGRVRARGYQQISFCVSSVEEFSSDELFDVVIGRYVLIHQESPSDFLRAARRHVRPGGVIGFHEVSCHIELSSLPGAPLFQRMAKLLRMAAGAFPSYDAAGRLLEHFRMADLPHPELFAELPVGGGVDSPLYAWMAETIGTLTPLLVKQGVVSAEEISIDTLEERLRTEAVEMQSQVVGNPQVCAWARLDGSGERERAGVTQSNLAYV